MQKNIGMTDRIIRFAISAILIIVGIVLGFINFNWIPFVLITLGIIVLLTAITQVSLIYGPLHYSSLVGPANVPLREEVPPHEEIDENVLEVREHHQSIHEIETEE